MAAKGVSRGNLCAPQEIIAEYTKETTGARPRTNSYFCMNKLI